MQRFRFYSPHSCVGAIPHGGSLARGAGYLAVVPVTAANHPAVTFTTRRCSVASAGGLHVSRARSVAVKWEPASCYSTAGASFSRNGLLAPDSMANAGSHDIVMNVRGVCFGNG